MEVLLAAFDLFICPTFQNLRIYVSINICPYTSGIVSEF